MSDYEKVVLKILNLINYIPLETQDERVILTELQYYIYILIRDEEKFNEYKQLLTEDLDTQKIRKLK